MRSYGFGPWPRGIDNLHDPYSDVFRATKDRPAQLRTATNLDISDDGWVRSRPAASVLTAASGDAEFFGPMASHGDMLLAQEHDMIVSVELGTIVPITAVSEFSKVSFTRLDEEIYWTDGVSVGRITYDGTPKNWGVAPPTISLGTVVGSSVAGQYQMAATCVDTHGIEGGAAFAVAVECSGTADIQVYLDSYPLEAAAINVYTSTPDSTGLYLAKTAAPASFPLTITPAELRSSFTPLETQFFAPPVPGTGVGNYKQRLFTYAGRWIFLSSAISRHTFNITEESLQLPYDILAAQGVEGGIWAATTGGLFWVAGGDLASMTYSQVDSRTYAYGSGIEDASNLPALRTGGECALFACDDGLVVGTGGGKPVYPTDESYRFGDIGGKFASFAYAERDDLRQLVVAIGD